MPVDAKRCLSKFFRGEFAASARDGCAFIEALDDPVTHPVPDAYPLPNELVATIAGTVGAARLLMLDPAGADEAADLVNARVEHLPFPFGPYSCAYAVSTLALGWYNARLEERALAAFALIRDVSERHGMTSYEILCNLQATMAEARFGAMGPDTIDRCEVLVEVWKATGLLAFVPCFGSVVATGRLDEGKPEASLAVTADCLAEAERMGARYWNAPLLRLRGEARFALDDDSGADDLQRAAALAAEQGARLFELQARTALCRLTGDPVATKELRDFLDAVPGDLDLPDVVDARTLLA